MSDSGTLPQPMSPPTAPATVRIAHGMPVPDNSPSDVLLGRDPIPGPVDWQRGLPTALPATLGRFRLLRLLGKGGMGAVYLAHDANMDRTIALKLPRFDLGVDQEHRERFLREASAASSLNHRHLCRVYDVGEIDGVYCISMAYVDGHPLSAYLRGGKRLPIPQAVGLVRKLALAVHTAHDVGIIHRDLKPGNIMIDPQGEPVILDFGLMRDVAGPRRSPDRPTAPLTQTGLIVGTPTYMSPEQVNGDTRAIGPSCDIYSLGVILYETITGSVPFQAPLIGDLIVEISEQPPPSPAKLCPHLDAELTAICLKALAKKPAERFGSCRDFATALEKCAAGMPVACLELIGLRAPPPVDEESKTQVIPRPGPPPRLVLRRSPARSRKQELIFTAVMSLIWSLVVVAVWAIILMSIFHSSMEREPAATQPAATQPAPPPRFPQQQLQRPPQRPPAPQR